MKYLESELFLGDNEGAEDALKSAKRLELRLDELWQYRDLIMLFVRRDFVAAYKQTILTIREGNSERVKLEIVSTELYDPTPPPDLGVSSQETIKTEDRFGG